MTIKFTKMYYRQTTLYEIQIYNVKVHTTNVTSTTGSSGRYSPNQYILRVNIIYTIHYVLQF